MEEISNKEYRNREGISSSDLKLMTKSMKTYQYFKENPEDKDSEALLFGRAYHKYCLEPYDFENEFIIIEDFNCGKKEGKQAYIEYVEEILGRKLEDNETKYKDSITAALMSCGKDIITKEMLNKIQDMRDVLYATPFVKKLIDGEHEKSFFWTDPNTDLVMKCRPDSFVSIGNENICVDLKTCVCAETSKFMRDAINLGYDIQAAHYCEGLKANFDKDYRFVFIAQEKTAPYLVNVLEADEDFMRSGYEVREVLLDQYKKCIEKGEFTGYMGFSDEAEINSLGVPNWLKKVYESEVEE